MFWVVLIILLLIILSLMFGGFRKGTKSGDGPAYPRLSATAASSGVGGAWSATTTVWPSPARLTLPGMASAG